MIIVKLLAINQIHKYDTKEQFEQSLDFDYSNRYPELYEIIGDKICLTHY